MKRRNFIQTSAYASLFTLLYGCKGSKIPTTMTIPNDAPYKMDYIRNGVGFFSERGGTIGWLANKDGMAVIDTQFPEQSEHLVAELMKINSGKLDCLINTHHHGDHTAGNPVYADLTDTIIAHKNSKENQMKSAQSRGNEDSQLYPNTLISDAYSQKIGDETLAIKYFGRAHTNGDIVVHFENANVAHIGDLVFNRRFPYIDIGAGASIENWINVLETIKKTYDNDTIFVYGHAGKGHDIKGGKDKLSDFQNYLEKLLLFGEKSMKAGITLEELKKTTQVIPGAEEWTGKGIERSLDAVYAEIGRE